MVHFMYELLRLLPCDNHDTVIFFNFLLPKPLHPGKIKKPLGGLLLQEPDKNCLCKCCWVFTLNSCKIVLTLVSLWKKFMRINRPASLSITCSIVDIFIFYNDCFIIWHMGIVYSVTNNTRHFANKHLHIFLWEHYFLKRLLVVSALILLWKAN